MIKLKNNWNLNIGLVRVRENIYKVILDENSHYFSKGYDAMDLNTITSIGFEGGTKLYVGGHIETIEEKVIAQTEDEDNVVEYYITFKGEVPTEIIAEE